MCSGLFEGALLVLTPASSGGLPRLLAASGTRDEPRRRSGPNVGACGAADVAAKRSPHHTQVLYFTTKPAGGNILTSAFLKEVRRFELMVNEQLYATHFGNSGPSRGGSYPELDLDDASVSASGSALCGTQTPSGFGQFAPPAPDHAQSGLEPQSAPTNGQMCSGWPATPAPLFYAGISVSYDDVCAQAETPSARNLADPSSGEVGGGASRCVSFGHPLELWYRRGDRGGSYDFETQSLSDAEISARVDSGRGVDESYATQGSNPSPADPRQVCYCYPHACASPGTGSSPPVAARPTRAPSSAASLATPTARSPVPRRWRSATCWRRRPLYLLASSYHSAGFQPPAADGVPYSSPLDHTLSYTSSYPTTRVTASITYGCRLYHIWLQSLSHTVAASITYGCRQMSPPPATEAPRTRPRLGKTSSTCSSVRSGATTPRSRSVPSTPMTARSGCSHPDLGPDPDPNLNPDPDLSPNPDPEPNPHPTPDPNPSPNPDCEPKPDPNQTRCRWCGRRTLSRSSPRPQARPYVNPHSHPHPNPYPNPNPNP